MNTSDHKSNETRSGEIKYLYRIITFQRLADILVNKENTLINPLKWDDPFEGWILKEG